MGDKGLQAGAGGDCRRHGVGQYRVDKGDLGQHGAMAQAHLDPLLGRREHGVAGYFGAGARGGGDGDEGRGR